MPHKQQLGIMLNQLLGPNRTFKEISGSNLLFDIVDNNVFFIGFATSDKCITTTSNWYVPFIGLAVPNQRLFYLPIYQNIREGIDKSFEVTEL